MTSIRIRQTPLIRLLLALNSFQSQPPMVRQRAIILDSISILAGISMTILTPMGNSNQGKVALASNMGIYLSARGYDYHQWV